MKAIIFICLMTSLAMTIGSLIITFLQFSWREGPLSWRSIDTLKDRVYITGLMSLFSALAAIFFGASH